MRILPVVPICRGSFACSVGQIHLFQSARLAPDKEGRIAIVIEGMILESAIARNGG